MDGWDIMVRMIFPFRNLFRNSIFRCILVSPWLTFGALGPPSGSLLYPLGSLLVNFWKLFWFRLAHFWHPFRRFYENFDKFNTFSWICTIGFKKLRQGFRDTTWPGAEPCRRRLHLANRKGIAIFVPPKNSGRASPAFHHSAPVLNFF